MIKKNSRLLKAFVIGEASKNSQRSYFNAILFSAFIFSIISSVFNFFESTNIILKIFTIFSSLILALLYYLSRFKGYHNLWISLITIMSLLSVFWFMNGGLIGSVPYIYLLSLILFVIIAKRKEQNVIFYLFVSNVAILYILEYALGYEIVNPYPDEFSHYIDMVFVFIMVLFCVFFLTRYIKRSYDNEKYIVNKQKKIIEDSNKEMLASLTYASDLQKKIISNGSKLNTLFQDHFVLFKPKDIVSGDFFWVKEKGKYGIVVAADCTGHGVPAAFLSILGISLFEEIIAHEGDVLNAGTILEKVRYKFIPYLRKDNSLNEQALDGMDLGICIVNYEDYTFQYSGANRPLIMIRNNTLPELVNYSEKETKGTHTLYTFKATKNTIGFNYNEEPFVSHSIEFFPTDTFYVFSDGYTDQFDAQNKKKFNARQLKSELLKLQNYPMASQGIFLNSMLSRWRGDTSQTDDILLIGLRL